MHIFDRLMEANETITDIEDKYRRALDKITDLTCDLGNALQEIERLKELTGEENV